MIPSFRLLMWYSVPLTISFGEPSSSLSLPLSSSYHVQSDEDSTAVGGKDCHPQYHQGHQSSIDTGEVGIYCVLHINL